jgi:L-serine dehydratase
MDLSLEDITKGMLAAGMIGLFIAQSATFAAEVGGCQVECGAGSSMAAAGLVQIMDGSAKQAVDAASMALQNVMGMVCDPVGDRVEVPCLGKNVMAGVNAIACANMALAGFDKVIPLDEVIDSMYKVGQMLPSELRCTGKGGLSVTPMGIKIFEKLNR